MSQRGARSSQLGGEGSGPAGRGGQSAGGGVSILHPLAGGMPLAFTQEVFLVFESFELKKVKTRWNFSINKRYI